MARLKILSWNTFGGKNLPEIIECLREADADIIGLQEVLQDENGDNNNAKTIAELLGYEWVYETTATLTPDISELLRERGIHKNMGWGNAILSKHAIADKKVHMLSETRKRIALEAIVMLKNREFHIFSTHLPHTHLQQSELQNMQIKNLLKIVPMELSAVMGDFNATPESATMQNIYKVMADTEHDTSKFTRDVSMHPCALCNTNIRNKIDYIFTTKDIKTISSGTIQSKASDHLPVYAVVELP